MFLFKSLYYFKGYFPVHICAKNNQLECLKILFDYGAYMQPKTNEGETPLHLAAKFGHINIVKWLIEHKTNALIMDNNKMTAYDLAKNNLHYEVANFLADLTGKPHVNPKDLPKIHQIKTKHTEAEDESPIARPRSPTPKLFTPENQKANLLQNPDLDNYSDASSDSNLNKSRTRPARDQERAKSAASSRKVASPQKLKTKSSSSSSSSSSSDSSDSDTEKKKTKSPINNQSPLKKPQVQKDSSDSSLDSDKEKKKAKSPINNRSDSDKEKKVASPKNYKVNKSSDTESDSSSSSTSTSSDTDTISKSSKASSKASKNSLVVKNSNPGIKSLMPNNLGYVIDHNPSEEKRPNSYRPVSGKQQAVESQNVNDKFSNKKRDSIESAFENLK